MLQDTTSNYTVFLPTESAIQSAIKNNLFSNKTTKDELLYHMLNGKYSLDTLSSKRHYLQTLSPTYPIIIVSSNNNNVQDKQLQVLAGPTIANVLNYTQCSNGIVYQVDQFLTTPLSAMDTISFLPNLNQLENEIKAQNLSGIFGNSNHTIFAPVDAAWAEYNGVSMPYGVIVHNLEYEVSNGVYFYKDLVTNNLTLHTDYLLTTINTLSFSNGTIAVTGSFTGKNSPQTIAYVTRTDILTSGGAVIHLVDKILPADSNADLMLLRNKKSIATTHNNNSDELSISKASKSTVISCTLFLLQFVSLSFYL
ncbi:MAG: hypothetical protein EXX96DRAFT_576527 [Benjaminiella poitrasii]|nr:MAG: hypothetical protein EXX96DRAFT_576527 [Benjaminiella poitrasii]